MPSRPHHSLLKRGLPISLLHLSMNAIVKPNSVKAVQSCGQTRGTLETDSAASSERGPHGRDKTVPHHARELDQLFELIELGVGAQSLAVRRKIGTKAKVRETGKK